MSIIRGTALRNYVSLVSELGGNPKELLYRAGVQPLQAGDHEVFLAYRGVVLAVEAAAAATGTPDFGRQLARRQGIEILGPVGVAARTAPTMGEALRICSVYLSAYSPSVQVRLLPDERADRTAFELRIVGEDLPPHPQTYELSLGVAIQVLRYLCGQDYSPLRVYVPHAAITSRESYRRYFGCTPRFDQRAAGFLLRTADLDAPIHSDVLAHEAIVRYLESIVADVDHGLSRPVRDLVRRLLPTGAVTMELVAAQFGLHSKTLQRRLTSEGTTFGSLVEQTRRELVERFLRDTDLGLTQVARELGYAEQSVLTRSCHRWFGTAPTTLRHSLRASVAARG